MSDPKHPGATPSGADPDSTIMRTAQEFYSEQDVPAGNSRAERVKDWVTRNNPARAEGTPRPASGNSTAQALAGQSKGGREAGPGRPVMPPSRTSQRADTAMPAQALGDQSPVGGRPNARAQTVPGGVGAVAAGSAGDQAGPRAADTNRTTTGAVASAVPPPESDDATAARSATAARRTRKARLRLSQIDPWSVMKTAFLFSVAAGIVLWVATGTIWAVVSSSGMFEEINRMVGDIIQNPGDDTPFRIQDYLSTSKVMGAAALIAVVDVVILTALATLGAFLYNLAAAMIGGLEVTLAED